MNVVLVGGGGREHALAWRIAKSPSLSRLVFTHENPGFAGLGVVDLAPDVDAMVDVAVRARAELVVVGPEAPLAAGLADRLAARGIPCFGPSQAASKLEASKAFAKEVMRVAGVPTAGALVVDLDDPTSLEAALERCRRGDVVVKADGLASGKGVFVCPSADEAVSALTAMRSSFGEAARTLVLEDLLTGPEVSLLAICDGERAVPLISAQDHKRLADGDRGPNTGGMGAYAPCTLVDDEAFATLCAQVHVPVLRAMAARGTPFRGVLYAGLMLTPDGPRVLEFNARFGDPETQPLMVLWDDDILPWLHGCAVGRVPDGRPRFRAGSACCVVVAAEGYPDAPVTGVQLARGETPAGGEVFFAGARQVGDTLLSSGGRVLGVTGFGVDARAGRRAAYAVLDGWRFPGCQARSDIAAQAD